MTRRQRPSLFVILVHICVRSPLKAPLIHNNHAFFMSWLSTDNICSCFPQDTRMTLALILFEQRRASIFRWNEGSDCLQSTCSKKAYHARDEANLRNKSLEAMHQCFYQNYPFGSVIKYNQCSMNYYVIIVFHNMNRLLAVLKKIIILIHISLYLHATFNRSKLEYNIQLTSGNNACNLYTLYSKYRTSPYANILYLCG